jgi:hypothetical protein
VLTTTPGVVLHLDAPNLQVEGPGKLKLSGRFTVRTTAGTRTATSLTMAMGPFRVTLAPGAGGLTVNAILQGPLTAT